MAFQLTTRARSISFIFNMIMTRFVGGTADREREEEGFIDCHGGGGEFILNAVQPSSLNRWSVACE